MSQGLTRSIVIAAGLLLVGACSSDREPVAPTPTAPAPSFSVAPSQSLDSQIETLIKQLFPLPVLRPLALTGFGAIELLVRKNRMPAAQKLATDFVTFTLNQYNKDRLIGDQSPATQAGVQSLINLLFQYVGLGAAPIPPGALGPDGAVAVVDSGGGSVVTGDKFAGVTIPAGALSQPTIVTLARNQNQDNPLPTSLDQFPLFYDFKTFPEVPVLGQPAVVGVCVLDAYIPEGRAPYLRLAHPSHADPSTLEILPLADASFLDCTNAGQGFGARKGPVEYLASAGKRMAGDLLWVMLGAPRDLQASGSRRLHMPGGLGGRTSSFSPFGAVDFDSTLVPYGASGFRYTQVDPTNSGGGFEQPGYDDSEWPQGDAAFGSGSVEGGQVCPLDGNKHTTWSIDTDLLLRRSFTLPGGAGSVKVAVAIDNDVQVFVNGVDVTASAGSANYSGGFQRHEGCATEDSFVFTVPDNVVHAGSNVLAIRARDRGVISYVDVRVSGQLTN
ncbi:MAG TPA: hypothetical protein VMH88_00620 [Gemmatimonadales bacterium]|nr:hypothetical protein [Gemmatimonadales bacterium]